MIKRYTPKVTYYRLTTTDSAVLSKYLQQQDRAWIGGGLIFLGGKLLTKGINAPITDRTIEALYNLVKDGVVERVEV